jgi:hypothetical protein
MKFALISAALVVGLMLAAAVSALGAGSSPSLPLAPGETSALQQPDQEPGKGARRHAAALAEEFGASEDEVLQLHKDGLGFGALFKVLQISRATGQDPAALIASFPTVDGRKEPGFGELFANLTAEQRQSLEDGPKNFGQLVSGRAKKR